MTVFGTHPDKRSSGLARGFPDSHASFEHSDRSLGAPRLTASCIPAAARLQLPMLHSCPSGSRVRTRPLAAVGKALNVSPNRLLGVDDQSERRFRLPQALEKLPRLTSFRERRAR
jgi:hypothetical protein